MQASTICDGTNRCTKLHPNPERFPRCDVMPKPALQEIVVVHLVNADKFDPATCSNEVLSKISSA